MSDDFEEMLEGEQSNPNAILLEILGDDYEAWDFIVAVEGPDDRNFYFDLIRNNLENRRPKFFSCGGKAGLIGFQSVAEEYEWREKPVFMYLIDKDFDDYLGLEYQGTFRTEFYSIESYFIGVEFVEYIIEKYCSKPLTNREKDVFLRAFQSRFDGALPQIRVVCALMCEMRANREHPQFNDFGIDKIFDLRDGMAVAPRVLENMKVTLNAGATVSAHQLIARVRSFHTNEFKRWMRGKLGMQVMRKVYELSKSDMPKAVADKLPPSNYFGSEAFMLSKSFIGNIESLDEYCKRCAA